MFRRILGFFIFLLGARVLWACASELLDAEPSHGEALVFGVVGGILDAIGLWMLLARREVTTGHIIKVLFGILTLAIGLGIAGYMLFELFTQGKMPGSPVQLIFGLGVASAMIWVGWTWAWSKPPQPMDQDPKPDLLRPGEIQLMGVNQLSGQACVVCESHGVITLAAGHYVLAHVPIGAAGVRIRLPSFFTTRFICIDSDCGETLYFEADSQATQQISELLDRCAGLDPAGTAAAYRAKSSRDLVIGVISLLVGIGITVLSYSVAPPKGTFFVMTGLIGLGAVEILRGIYFGVKAGQHS